MGPASHTADLAIGGPGAIAVDRQNRVYTYTFDTRRIWQLDQTAVAAIAGNGANGDAGDGGAALSAQLSPIGALAVDAQGAVHSSNSSSPRIRKIDSGQISTVYSNSDSVGFGGIAFDSQNRLTTFSLGRLARLEGTALKTIPLTAPTIPGFSGNAVIGRGVAADARGNLFYSDLPTHRVFKVDSAGVVTLVAGTGVAGYSGDGGPAAQAALSGPTAVAVDGDGNIFILDGGNNRVRMVTPIGVIYTIAGNGIQAYSGDGGPASLAAFDPRGIGLGADSRGNLYISDFAAGRVRKLAPAGGVAPRLDAILHGASGDARLSPGSLFSVYGSFDVGEGVTIGSDVPWSGSLKGITAYVNGVIAPIYGITKNQVNGQIPYETAPGQASIVITVNGSTPKQLNFPVVAANPGILIFGDNRAVAVNQDFNVNTPTAGAKPGTYETLYFSGLGIPDHPVGTGFGAPSAEPLARAQYAFSVKLNGQATNVVYFGLAPTYPALAQTNFQVPDVPPGEYTLTISLNGIESNATKFTVAAK